MNVLIAIDSFKGTFSSIEGCEIIKQAIYDSGFTGKVFAIPQADGGEGSLDIVKSVLGGKDIEVEVMGPCLTNIKTHYLLVDDKAYIESALVLGYTLNDGLTILNRTSEGLGTLIKDAIIRGAKEINIFLGGSCTNDAGLGMLYALGAKFFDKENKALYPLPEIYNSIDRIDVEGLNLYKDIKINAIVDVDNPFIGNIGASKTFAKQKGATDEEINILEDGFIHLVDIIKNQYKEDIGYRSGYGASGGISMALNYFLNAPLYKGSEYFTKLTNLNNYIKEVDYVITGEGKLDHTSFNGKVVSSVISLSNKYHKEVLLIVGKIDLSKEECNKLGIKHLLIMNQEEKDIDVIKLTAKNDLYTKTLEYFKQKNDHLVI